MPTPNFQCITKINKKIKKGKKKRQIEAIIKEKCISVNKRRSKGEDVKTQLEQRRQQLPNYNKTK